MSVTGHLTARFLTSLSTAPPPVDDEVWADRWLTPGERSLWIWMSNQDRRHSIAVARRFLARRPGATRAEVAGALLHDVGKIDCGLGTFGRVAATVVGPRGPAAFLSYHAHEPIGAALAESVGSDPATVDLIAQRGPAFDDLDRGDHA